MDLHTGTKRAWIALFLTILCCACDPSSEGSGSSADASGEDDSPLEGSVRIEETDLDTVFSDGWVHANTAHDWSGGTAASTTGSASMSLNFTGTRVRWIGWRESGAGKARVLLDGELVETVDLYSNTIKIQAPIFTSEELQQGPHTLTIEATGTANSKSGGTTVFVDAFEVVSLDGSARPLQTRVEETSSALSMTGEWNVDTGCRTCSGGRDTYTRGPDATASFIFNGTRARWLGWRKKSGGLANLYLDGAFVGEVDLYSVTTSSQVPLFTSEVLANGPHTLLIEITGAANPAATDSVVSVDAFIVAGPIP